MGIQPRHRPAAPPDRELTHDETRLEPWAAEDLPTVNVRSRIRIGYASDHSSPTVAPPFRHKPARPAWTCNDCGVPWPCEPKRQEMLAAADGFPAALHGFMSAWLTHAVDELPDVPADELRERFLGWVPGES